MATLKSEAYIYSEDDLMRPVSCGAMGSLAASLSEDDLDALLNDILGNVVCNPILCKLFLIYIPFKTNFSFPKDSKKYADSDWTNRHANCMILSTLLQHNAARIHGKKNESTCLKFLTSCVTSDKTPVVKSAIRSIGFYMDYLLSNNIPIENDLVTILSKVH